MQAGQLSDLGGVFDGGGMTALPREPLGWEERGEPINAASKACLACDKRCLFDLSVAKTPHRLLVTC